MEKSLQDTYGKEYLTRISKMFDNIHQLEDEIKNIKVEYKGSNKTYEIIIKFKYSSEVWRYFQLNDGSIGYDVFIIRYLLHSLLCYVYIAQEKELTVEEQETCSLEIETRFYFLLNCIYNIKEKLEKFFNYDVKNKKLKNSVLTKSGIATILELFDKFYPIIKDYCAARNHIVHDIYLLKYDTSTNQIYVSYSTFDLSEGRLINKKGSRLGFYLEASELIKLVEGIQRIRKQTVEILSDIRNIDLEKLKRKFLNEKGKAIIVKG